MRFFGKLMVFLLVAALVLGIAAWNCPAELAYRGFRARLAPITLAGISDSVWNGHADSLRLFGREVGVLDWRLGKRALLQRELATQFNVRSADTNAAGLLVRRGDGMLDLRDATMQLPATLLEPAIGVPDLHLAGRIEIALAQARLHGAWVESAEGTALWHDAAVSGAAQARLSDLRASFAPPAAGGGIAGEVHDLGGPLAVDGTFEIAALGYRAQLRLAARDGDVHVLDALQHVGQPQTDGSALLLIHGGPLGAL